MGSSASLERICFQRQFLPKILEAEREAGGFWELGRDGRQHWKEVLGWIFDINPWMRKGWEVFPGPWRIVEDTSQGMRMGLGMRKGEGWIRLEFEEFRDGEMFTQVGRIQVLNSLNPTMAWDDPSPHQRLIPLLLQFLILRFRTQQKHGMVWKRP